MKLSQAYTLTPLLAVIILIASCNGKNQDSASANDIVFDTIHVSKVYHIDNDSTKPSCSLKIKYIVPIKYVDTLALNKMQHEISLSFLGSSLYNSMQPKAAIEKYIDDYIESYKEDVNSLFSNWDKSDESDDYFSYYKTLEGNLLYNKSNILSYQTKSVEYKGGANAYTGYKNLVVNVKTGTILNEKDIFTDGYKNALDQMLLLKLMQQNKVKNTDDLFELGYSRIEDFTSNNNFLVDNKGITYIFNQGDYSIPTLGEIKITLAYDELKLILKEDSPISPLTNK